MCCSALFFRFPFHSSAIEFNVHFCPLKYRPTRARTNSFYDQSYFVTRHLYHLAWTMSQLSTYPSIHLFVPCQSHLTIFNDMYVRPVPALCTLIAIHLFTLMYNCYRRFYCTKCRHSKKMHFSIYLAATFLHISPYNHVLLVFLTYPFHIFKY